MADYLRVTRGFREGIVPNRLAFDVSFGPPNVGEIQITLDPKAIAITGGSAPIPGTQPSPTTTSPTIYMAPSSQTGPGGGTSTEGAGGNEVVSVSIPASEFRIELLNASGAVVLTGAAPLRYPYQLSIRPTAPLGIRQGATVSKDPPWKVRVTYIGTRYSTGGTTASNRFIDVQGSIAFTSRWPLKTRTIPLEILNRKLDEQINVPKPIQLSFEKRVVGTYTDELNKTYPINNWCLVMKLAPELAIVHPEHAEHVIDLREKAFINDLNIRMRPGYWIKAVTHEGHLAFRIDVDLGKGSFSLTDFDLDVTFDQLKASIWIVSRPDKGGWDLLVKPEVVADGLWGAAEPALNIAISAVSWHSKAQSFWDSSYIQTLYTYLVGRSDTTAVGAVDDGATLLYAEPPTVTLVSSEPPPAPMVISPANVEILRSKIDHIVVVMMENRSFDHMLGYLSLPPWNRTDVHGLRADYSNPVFGSLGTTFTSSRDQRAHVFPIEDTSPAVRKVGVSADVASLFAVTRFLYDPGHSFASTRYQRGGYQAYSPSLLKDPFNAAQKLISVGPMEGFVADFERRLSGYRFSNLGELRTQIMGYYTERHLPTYHFLAENFRICDHWHAAVPGQTWPNRFVTLTGHLIRDQYGRPSPNNPNIEKFDPLEDLTIFDHLTAGNVNWRYYEHDFCFLRLFSRYTFDSTNILPASRFFEDARRGDLSSVTFIEPDLTDITNALRLASDDHPPSDIRYGQAFIRQIYDALRNNPKWEKTLLIITYDEHGGFYDHVFPGEDPNLAPLFTWPLEPVVPASFPYEKYPPLMPNELPIKYRGMRVPTFLVSPHVTPRSASHTEYDHTSIIKTIITRFLYQRPPYMGPRVAQAKDLALELIPQPVKPAPPTAPSVQLPTQLTVQPRGVDLFPTPDDLSDESSYMLRQFRERTRKSP